MQTDRAEMIARVKKCLAKGANPNTMEAVDIVSIDDPDWEHRDTLVSLYMYRVLCYQRGGVLDDRLDTFMLPKAARASDPFDREQAVALAAAYVKTWDGETGDLDKLHEFVDFFTTDQLAYIGI